jgi:hypothetical protein
LYSSVSIIGLGVRHRAASHNRLLISSRPPSKQYKPKMNLKYITIQPNLYKYNNKRVISSRPSSKQYKPKMNLKYITIQPNLYTKSYP